MQIGDRLRHARGTRTIREVAIAAGITERHLLRLEKNEHAPTDRVLGRLADALGTTPAELQDKAAA